MVQKKPRIGPSLISFFPESYGPGGIFPGGLLRVAEHLDDLEMGMQLVPMVGHSLKQLEELSKKFPDIVLSYEGPWSKDTSFLSACHHALEHHDPLAFVGPFIFGRKALKKVRLFKKIFPNAIGIDVEDVDPDGANPNYFDPKGVIEISPKRYIGEGKLRHRMTMDEYLAYGQLCFDSEHIREKPLITGDIGRIPELIGRLTASGSIKVVQIQTRKLPILLAFARGELTCLDEDLIALQPVLSNSDVPVILEFLPNHILQGARIWGGLNKFWRTLKRRVERYIYLSLL